MDDPQGIPWSLSDMEPCELKTLKDMSPEQAKQARQDAEYWAKESLATWKWDRCQRCGERYAVLSPECGNYREHEVGAGRLEKEKEVEAILV